MTGLVDWAAARARMVLAFIALSLTIGYFAYEQLPKEGEPDIEIPALFVSVPFPGISAADSETLLVKPMETELSDLDGLKTMSGTAAENYAGVALEFDLGWDKTKIMADVAEQMGAPKGLIQCLDQVSIEGTAELMRHRRTSVVMATGGPAMVKAAYSSGKPTLAVGAGNVPCYVHGSMKDEIPEVAEMIVTSKSFDYGTACVSEQAVIADKTIARELRHEMKLKGAYFCTGPESDRLAKAIFRGPQAMDPNRVGQSPEALAKAAGFSIPPRTRCLVSEETEIGWQRPLSAEKLNPVLAFYEARDDDHGIELSHGIAKFEGWGHSSVVHSNDPDIVARFATVPTGRVLVNTPAIMGGMGYSTDLEPSFMLGTGTWSGSITSDNVTALHLINIKRVAYQNRPWRDIYEEYGE